MSILIFKHLNPLNFLLSQVKLIEYLQLQIKECLQAFYSMELSSSSTNKEKTLLPSLTKADKTTASKRERKDTKRTKGSRKKKSGEDIFAHLPELSKTTTTVNKASEAKKSKSRSSPLKTHQNEVMPTQAATKPNERKNPTTAMKNRSKKLRLPPLVLTPSTERIASEEKWSAALNLRDSYEVPLGVFNKLMDDIAKINNQMKQEEMINRITDKRMRYDAERKRQLLLSQTGDFYTPLPGFSYFPGLVKSQELDSNELLKFEDIRAESRIFRQERTIQRKMSQFKNRHSHVNIQL